MNIKILSKKTLLNTDLFTVSQLNLEYPSKAKHTHVNAERRSSISVFPITERYEIYLISQYRYMLCQTTTEAVGGYIDEGESALAGAKRELKEETGISAMQIEQIAKLEMAASVIRSVNYVFIAKGLEFGDPALEDGEDIKLVKITLSDAVLRVFSGEIKDSTTVAGILLLDSMKKNKRL